MIEINHRKLLKEWRKEKGLTRKNAAKILGVAHNTYINYENGNGHIGEARGDYIVEKVYRSMTGRSFRGDNK